jgi:hypothetical protein
MGGRVLVVVPASSWIAKIPQSLPTLMEKLSFLQRPIALFEQGLQAFHDAVPSDGAEKVVEVKQSTDMGGKMLGIGSTVLAGSREPGRVNRGYGDSIDDRRKGGPSWAPWWLATRLSHYQIERLLA